MQKTIALVGVVLGLALSACGDSPTPTGAVCPSPDDMSLTYENFGKPFMEKYCTWCHAADLPRSKRNDAPVYHDYDTLLGVRETEGHVDEQTGIGPDATNRFMPPDKCPTVAGEKATVDCMQPTDEERKQLAVWLACEKDRPYHGEPPPDGGLPDSMPIDGPQTAQ
ncbi:MAG TPA: hypothetical protein VGM39_02760 [Kofleriaceae bacterium]